MNYSKYLINEDPVYVLPSLAAGIGLNEAILLQKIHGWLRCTPKEHVGRNWIYNSYKSWHEQLPFMSETTIKRAIKNLVELGVVITHNFNKQSFDKTLWYSIDYEKLESVVESKINAETIDSVKSDYRLGQNDTTIVSKWTDNTNNNYNKENINNINIINTKERFKKPTLQEVESYCKERNNGINASTFIDFYESKGWKVGKTPMKDWRACIRTWERNTNNKTKTEPEWFYKDLDKEDTTLEEQEELDKLLSSMTEG